LKLNNKEIKSSNLLRYSKYYSHINILSLLTIIITIAVDQQTNVTTLIPSEKFFVMHVTK